MFMTSWFLFKATNFYAFSNASTLAVNAVIKLVNSCTFALYVASGT